MTSPIDETLCTNAFFSVPSSGGDRYHPQLVSSDFMPDAASPRALPRQSPFLPPPHPPRPIDHFGLPGRQWSPQRHPAAPPPHYLKASGARAAAAAAAEMQHLREQRKASTMDGDKRRLFLDRMRNNGHFHNLTSSSEAAAATAAARSRSNESSYRVRPSESFYMREAISGFRSLSTDSRAGAVAARGSMSGMSSSQQPQSAVIGLFCDEEDEPPLLMSSVDGGSGGGSGRCMRRRVMPTGGDVIDTVEDCSPMAVAQPGCDAFAPSCSGQFSLSTPDFGAPRQHPHQGQGDPQQGNPPQQSQQHPQSSQKGVSGGSSSYSSLRSKIKSVQERYKKSSVSNRFRAKFGAKQGEVSPTRNPAPNLVVGGTASSSQVSAASLEVSKFRSHSHGALHSLNEFQHNLSLNNEAVDENIPSPRDWSNAKNETVTTATVEPLPKSSMTSSGSSASSSGSNPSTPRLSTSTPKASSSSSSSSAAAAVLKKKNKGMSMMGKSKSTEAVSAVGDIDDVRSSLTSLVTSANT